MRPQRLYDADAHLNNGHKSLFHSHSGCGGCQSRLLARSGEHLHRPPDLLLRLWNLEVTRMEVVIAFDVKVIHCFACYFWCSYLFTEPPRFLDQRPHADLTVVIHVGVETVCFLKLRKGDDFLTDQAAFRSDLFRCQCFSSSKYKTSISFFSIFSIACLVFFSKIFDASVFVQNIDVIELALEVSADRL